MDGQRGDAGLEPAGGAEQVAGHRLGRRDGQLPRVVAEAALDRHRLDLVAVRRRRAVGVDVVDPVRLDAGALERRAPSPGTGHRRPPTAR